MTTTGLLGASLAAVVLLGLSAGVHVSGVAALNPALRALDPMTYVAVKQSTDRHFPALMKPLTLAGLGALLTQTVLAALDGHASVAGSSAVGLLAAVLALLAVLRGDLPINQQMARWTRVDPPADWLSWRSRWEHFFVLRTLATLVAFLAAITSLALLP